MEGCVVTKCDLKQCIGKQVCALRKYYLLAQKENRKLLRELEKGSTAYQEVHKLIYQRGASEQSQRPKYYHQKRNRRTDK
jgi:hypothetical protein